MTFSIQQKTCLRSDTSTALLDRNLASQLLDGGHRDRSKRHIFELRTYLWDFPIKKNRSETISIN